MKNPKEVVVGWVFAWLVKAEPKTNLLFHLEPKGTVEPARLQPSFRLWLLKKWFPDAYRMFVYEDTYRWELWTAHLEKDPAQQKMDEEMALRRFTEYIRVGLCSPQN